FFLGDSSKQGEIINMSTSGCAIMTSDTLPPVNENLEVSFSFENKTQGPNEFIIQSKVVRSEDGIIAVSFSMLDSKVKNNLWKYILAAGS
ncbi:MAG: PilZ domain-containing protein, partial [Desulfobacteraceae bacterium]|nr:PilZ domain-containing protein [Desulfobacteraceae bacterium]